MHFHQDTPGILLVEGDRLHMGADLAPLFSPDAGPKRKGRSGLHDGSLSERCCRSSIFPGASGPPDCGSEPQFVTQGCVQTVSRLTRSQTQSLTAAKNGRTVSKPSG